MSARYEEVRPPRFAYETNGPDERFVIPAERKYFQMAFLAFWLCGWTAGGVTAIINLLTASFQPFLIFWLCGWLIGECFAFVSLFWMLTGHETLTLLGSDLEVSYTMLGFSRRRLYRGGDIRDLAISIRPPTYRSNQINLPIFANNSYGTIKFSYGTRTVHVASSLDEAEGRIIVDAMQRRW
jgi:hypothetical protein